MRVKPQRVQHILVVRTDRMGDVILTLPTVAVLRKCLPEARVVMLLREYTRGLAEGQEGVAEVLVFDEDGRPKPFWAVLKELRRLRFDAAVIAYPRFRIALLLWLAGIPVRVGTGYRWYSLLFNRRVYEHRKSAEKSEAAYNLSLLRPLGCDVEAIPRPRILPNATDRAEAERRRHLLGIAQSDRLVLLHPGSGGSARTWSPSNFAMLGAALAAHGFSPVVTGGAMEKCLVDRVVAEARGAVRPLVGGMTLTQFAAFIETAEVFVANSTGPLHLAAAVGTPVVGLYPPVRVMSSVRWGPLTDRRVVFVPDPARCSRCRGGRCRGNDCMDQISVESVERAVVDLAGGEAERRT